MLQKTAIPIMAAVLLVICFFCPKAALAQAGLQNVNHIIIVMQENHSFDTVL